MKAYEFQEFLYDQIPITKAMRILVIEYGPASTKVMADLEPNINHQKTAFGGSINTIMTVCGWAQVHAIIAPHDSRAHIVIQKSSIEYKAPIKGDIVAECAPVDETAISDFLNAYDRFGKARIDISVKCVDKGIVLASFEARYVALKG